MNSRGLVITIDSFLGITLLFILIIAAFSIFSNVSISAWNSIDLRNAVNDEATVLAKGMVLENSVMQSSSELLSGAINSTPPGMCFEVTIEEASDYSPLLHATKNGCTKSSGDIVSVNRSLVVRKASSILFYIVKVEGWSR